MRMLKYVLSNGTIVNTLKEARESGKEFTTILEKENKRPACQLEQWEKRIEIK